MKLMKGINIGIKNYISLPFTPLVYFYQDEFIVLIENHLDFNRRPVGFK
jgi:hypothetical protein